MTMTLAEPHDGHRVLIRGGIFRLRLKLEVGQPDYVTQSWQCDWCPRKTQNTITYDSRQRRIATDGNECVFLK